MQFENRLTSNSKEDQDNNRHDEKYRIRQEEYEFKNPIMDVNLDVDMEYVVELMDSDLYPLGEEDGVQVDFDDEAPPNEAQMA